MIKFLKFLKCFDWFVIIFMSLIFAIVIPNLIKSHGYLELFILFSITTFLFALLFLLNRYFFSMSINFDANEKYSCFTYSNGTTINIEHFKVKSVKCYTQRYKFELFDGKKIYLTRFEKTSKFNVLILEKTINPLIERIYAEKLIIKG